MIAYLLGPLGFVLHVAMWAAVAAVLHRERFALWAAVLLGFFVELGCVVAIVQAALNVADGKAWNGA